jgi:hypothetical protein
MGGSRVTPVRVTLGRVTLGRVTLGRRLPRRVRAALGSWDQSPVIQLRFKI